MTEQNQIRRVGVGFTTVSNKAMRDTRLSIEARGLLAMLLGMSESWKFRASDIMKRCGSGRDKYQRMMRELRDFGYVQIAPTRQEGAKFAGNEWIIDCDGDGKQDAGSRETRKPENPAYGKTGPLRKNNPLRNNNKKEGDLFGETEKSSPPDRTPDLNEQFETWWSEDWPRHERKADKKRCRDKFVAIMKAKDAPSIEDFRSATRAFVASVRDRQYLPGPLRFFTQEKYLPFLGQDAKEAAPNEFQRMIARART